MDNERNLASPNYGSAVSGLVGATLMALAARKGPKWAALKAGKNQTIEIAESGPFR